MTADERRHCGNRDSDYCRPKTTSTTRRTAATCTAAAVVVVVVVAAVAVTATRATTFEGGETATVPPDDTVYMTEEVAAWNATAAANGDYVYDDDYDSSTADAMQTPPGNRHYSTRPVRPVTRVDASTVVPAATITVQIHSAAVTEVPVAAVTEVPVAAVTEVPVADASSAATTVATAANTTAAAIDPTTATTESAGVLMQIASPPGYEATTAIVTTTTPTPATPSSSAPLPRCRRWTATLLPWLALIAAVTP